MVEAVDHAITAFSPFPERSIRTYEDWHAYVAKPVPVKPAMPTYAAFKAMSQAEKKEFNRVRATYHCEFGPLLVPDMENIHNAGLRLARQNLRAQPGARPGVIMDGISTVGKSTIAMQLGRRYEKLITNEHTITRTPTGDVFVPVAFIALPGEVNIMNFNYLLADFYNIPFSKKSKEGELTKSIKQHAADCCTSMVIIDDIHFLRIKNRTHEIVNEHMKHLANYISATFVYAGVNVKGSGFITEGNNEEKAPFSQNAHRFKIFNLAPFNYHNDESKEQFLRVIAAFEDNLLLFNHRPHSLAEEVGEYIWTRTGGYMGPIATLIREATDIAIKDGKERITKSILQSIKLDSASELHFRLRGKQREASAQKSKA